MNLQIPDFSKARTLVVGDLMLDKYWKGSTSRISPEAPVPVVHVRDCENRPGGAGNVALNLAVLCGSTMLDGYVGKDAAGAQLKSLLEESGVQCCFELLPEVTTVSKMRVLSSHQQLLRLDFEEGFFDLDDTVLLARFEKSIAQVDVIVLSDYAKGTLSLVPEFIKMARQAGKTVLIDPKGNDFSIYRGASLLTPNMGEFEAIVGRCHNDEQVVAGAENLRQELALDALLVTRGERGMTLIREAHPPVHFPTRAREVFDVTGAGDTVISVLAAALAAGQPMDAATGLANLAAGIAVSKLGAVAVTAEDMQVAISSHQQPKFVSASKMLDETSLLDIIHRAKALGERIVFTNGCFDILHAGHVRYLEQARCLGDRLLIAVNDDASVSDLKGDSRPINNLQQRMTVLAALESVDWVVSFSESTPARLISELLPDVLVKGGDYQPDEIAGADSVRENGGEIIVLDFHEGHSTTRIINSILENKD